MHPVRCYNASACGHSILFCWESAYLALVTVNQDRVVLRIAKDIKSVGDILEGNGNGVGLVRRDRDPDMLDAVFFHEGHILRRIILRHEREDSFQTKGAQMVKVAAHWEAAPVDAWSDFAEIGDGS